MPRFGIRSLLALTAIAAASIAFYQYTKYYKRMNMIEEVILKIDRDGDLYQNRRFYREVFSIAETDLLPWLKRHPDGSIAIQAAWESAELSVPLEEGQAPFKPDMKKLQDFLGLVENRYHAPIPDWWRKIVLGASANQRYDFGFPMDHVQPQYHRTNAGRTNCPINASLERKNKYELLYREKGNEIKIINEFLGLEKHETLRTKVTGHFTPDHFYLTTAGGIGYSHTVTCVDRETLEIVWRSKACGCWVHGIIDADDHYQWVEFASTVDGQLVVFGAACTGLYLHVFDSATGDSLVHFSTWYSRY